MTNLDSTLKSRDITLPTKVCLVMAIVFPVVMYGYESWTVKRAKRWRTDAFELNWSPPWGRTKVDNVLGGLGIPGSGGQGSWRAHPQPPSPSWDPKGWKVIGWTRSSAWGRACCPPGGSPQRRALSPRCEGTEPLSCYGTFVALWGSPSRIGRAPGYCWESWGHGYACPRSVSSPSECRVLCVCSVMSDSLRPHALEPARLLLSMGFSRQEYWSGLPFPPPGHLPNPGLKLRSFSSPALAGRFFTISPPGMPKPCHS